MKTVAIILFLSFMSACNPVKNKATNTDLYQTWVDSREENKVNASSKVFRPSTFKVFPISRFRMAYTFHNNGKCSYKWLSPIDKHELRTCTYTFNNGKIQLFNEKKQTVKTLKVLSLSSNKLLIQDQ